MLYDQNHVLRAVSLVSLASDKTLLLKRKAFEQCLVTTCWPQSNVSLWQAEHLLPDGTVDARRVKPRMKLQRREPHLKLKLL